MKGGTTDTPDRFCWACGRENLQGALFCSSCGAGLSQSPPYTQPPYRQGEQLRHSWLGVVSFVLGLASAALASAAIADCWRTTHSLNAGVGLVRALLVVAFTALILGIVGLFQPHRKNLFAVLGIVLSLVSVAFFFCFVYLLLLSAGD